MHPAIAQLAADRTSGATALVLRGIGILQSVASSGPDLEHAARDLCRAQPSMGGMHTAAALALAADDPHQALAMLATRVARSAAAIARLAAPLVALRRHTRPPFVSTYSASAAVEATLLAIAAREPLHVACSESRPAREGVDFAARLAATGIRTSLYTDAGLSIVIPQSDALIVGADALGGSGFINKVGTSALAALAAAAGVPACVLAGREKVLPDEILTGLTLREGESHEVGVPGDGYQVRNPYFERIPWTPIAHVITDSAQLHPGEVFSGSIWSGEMVWKYLSALR